MEIIVVQITTWARNIMPVDLHESKRQNEHTSVPLFVHEVMHILFIFSEAWMGNVFLTDLINTPTYIKKYITPHNR